MPFQYRVNYRMVLQQQGWTYSFYCQADSASAALTDSTKPNILAALLAIHTPSAYLQSVATNRVPTQETPLIPREGASKVFMQAGTGGLTNNRTPDVTSVSVHCSLIAGGKARPLYLRGLPDAATLRANDTGIMVLHPSLSGAITAFIGQKPGDGTGILVTEGFQMRYLVGPDQPLGGWKDVATITSAAGGSRSIITTIGNHGFTAGQQVLFSLSNKVADLPYKGEFRVIDTPSLTTFTVAAAYRYADDPHAPQLMRVRRAAPVFANLTGGEAVALRHRDTGRPRNLTKGRETGVSARRV